LALKSFPEAAGFERTRKKLAEAKAKIDVETRRGP
jgi:hypothetical protein